MSRGLYHKPENPLAKIRDKDPRAIAHDRVVRALRSNDLTGFAEALDRATKRQANDRVFCAAVLHDISALAIPAFRASLTQQVLDIAPADLHEQPHVVAAALSDGACDMLPLLGAAGCQLSLSDVRGQRALANLLSDGKWPHPNLVFPRLLQHDKVRTDTFGKMFSSVPPIENGRGMDVAIFEKLHALEHHAPFVRNTIHECLGELNRDTQAVDAFANTRHPVDLLKWLGRVEWLDIERFVQAHDATLAPKLRALLQRAELEHNTVEPVRVTRAVRL